MIDINAKIFCSVENRVMGEKRADNHQPLISIVTPVYNGEKFFVDTINTVCNQTYTNWEWIIVDDKSSDKTRGVVNGAIRDNKGRLIRLIELDKNSGAAKARNVGTKEAKGEYLCFLDADDLWEPTKLEKQLKFMQEKDCAFSFTGYEFADANGRPNGKVVAIPEKISYKQALRNTTISTITVMFDLRKLSSEYIMMPDVLNEDTATWWRILRKTGFAYGLNEPLSYYRRTNSTRSSNKVAMAKSVWGLYRNHEELSLLSSMSNFVGYAFNAVRRRV